MFSTWSKLIGYRLATHLARVGSNFVLNNLQPFGHPSQSVVMETNGVIESPQSNQLMQRNVARASEKKKLKHTGR